jgi:hypothetical protein
MKLNKHHMLPCYCISWAIIDNPQILPSDDAVSHRPTIARVKANAEDSVITKLSEPLDDKIWNVCQWSERMSLVLEMYEVLDNDEHTQEGWLRPERLSFAPISGRYISYALYNISGFQYLI